MGYLLLAHERQFLYGIFCNQGYYIGIGAKTRAGDFQVVGAAQDSSRFLRTSFFVEFSSMCSVSMENPQRI